MNCSSQRPDRRLVLTGAAGFIGRHARARLETSGAWEVLAIDLAAARDGDLVADLRRRDDVEQVLKDRRLSGGAEIVVHLAAALVAPGRERDMGVLYDNLLITEHVARIAAAAGARKVVHASTMAVYPNRTGIYSESSPTWAAGNTECLYGLSKICAEQLLEFLLRPAGCRVAHLRFAQILGPGMRSDRTPARMEEELRQTGKVTVFGDGSRESNYIDVADAVAAIVMFAKNDASGVFNVGGEQLSHRELAERIVARAGDANARIRFVPGGEQPRVVLDCSKYRALAAGQS